MCYSYSFLALIHYLTLIAIAYKFTQRRINPRGGPVT